VVPESGSLVTNGSRLLTNVHTFIILINL